MKIEVLYFEGCPNHPPAVALAKDVASELGVEAEIVEVDVKDREDAERLRFFGSPTLHVNGIDIDPAARERTDYSFSCRTYEGVSGAVPRELLVSAISEAGDKESRNAGSSSCCTPKEEAEKTTGNRAGLIAAGGSVVSAAIASACCWLPLLLLAFGLSAAGVSGWFEAVRPFFLGAAAILLGAGFYLAYFRKEKCAPGTACATPKPKLKRFNRGMLWVATVAVIAFAFFPNYVGLVTGNSTTSAQATQGLPKIDIQIEGMTCEACSVHVKKSLEQVAGVRIASVSYSKGLAVVSVDSESPPSYENLVEAVEKAGYRGTVEDKTRNVSE